jgi:integrase
LAALLAFLGHYLLGRFGCKGASARAASFSRSVGGR